jgi:hypothetical protein
VNKQKFQDVRIRTIKKRGVAAMKKFIITVAAIFLLVISHSKRVAAEEAPPANPYSGDLSSRSTLTGDWWGIRN